MLSSWTEKNTLIDTSFTTLNINTAIYEFARYLDKILSPLSRSGYTVSSTIEITEINKLKFILDVKSLFTNFLLDSTIYIILNSIYDRKELAKNIEHKDMTVLILSCRKNVLFTFNNDIDKQTDGVAMGSGLGPLLAGIITVELENSSIICSYVAHFSVTALKIFP